MATCCRPYFGSKLIPISAIFPPMLREVRISFIPYRMSSITHIHISLYWCSQVWIRNRSSTATLSKGLLHVHRRPLSLSEKRYKCFDTGSYLHHHLSNHFTSLSAFVFTFWKLNWKTSHLKLGKENQISVSFFGFLDLRNRWFRTECALLWPSLRLMK